MPARARWVAAAAAAVLAAAAGALVWVAQPTQEERTEAREQACAVFAFSFFAGPGFAAALVGEIDDLTDEFDAGSDADVGPDVTLDDIDAAGPAFADPLRDMIAVGVAEAHGEELSAEQGERYTEALVALSKACDEADLLDQDGAADPQEPDDPAVRDMLERMEEEPDVAPSEPD